MKFKHKLKFDTTEELNASFTDGNKTISDIMEEYEDYERCQKIKDALHYLKTNQ